MTGLVETRYQEAPPPPAPLQRIRRALGRNPELSIGCLLVAGILVVVLAPWLLTAASPTAIDTGRALRPPSAEHWFGTDDVGRDVYARAIFGARITLGSVAGSLVVSAILGGVFGLLAGFVGRLTDLAAGRLIDVILSFPPIVLGVVITGVLGPGLVNLMLALSIVYVPVFFRIARSGAMAEAQETYVEAARALGVSETAILLRHVLRNVLPLILLQYTILFPLALQIQAALGFLGLGVQPPTPDWGAALNQGKDFVLFAPWMSIFPGLFILISALSVILLGRGLQRVVDTR
jgi:peptide/nickel transport system permease protein